MHWILSAVINLCIAAVACYPSFQNNIPNGNNVDHPCQPNVKWQGVGHLKKEGGGPRNPFGLDVAANNMEWDTTLCEMDSDGDGMTNGYELGDPNCVWVAGQGITPERVIDITHPGICDPFNAPQCYQANTDFTISCTSIQFNCPATRDPGVTSYTYNLPPTPVPVKETIYMCMVFDFPQGQDIHQIAYEPFIDNANVMHHITIMGCMPGRMNFILIRKIRDLVPVISLWLCLSCVPHLVILCFSVCEPSVRFSRFSFWSM